MSILIVGNIVKDIYLNLDTRTEHFETDKNRTKWLNLSFNASEHHFFNRTSCLNGAAISLEVCQNFQIPATITNSNLEFSKDHEPSITTTDYRYIMSIGDQSTSFTSTARPQTIFTPPTTPPDYIYIDRSAHLSLSEITKIANYLQDHPTKLILYLTPHNLNKLSLLAPLAHLIFLESTPSNLKLKNPNIVFIQPNFLKYKNIKEPLNLKRADFFTHLSLFSIASATILCNFILGKSVEYSLKMARLNTENSRLNATLTLEELQNLLPSVNSRKQLELIAKMLISKPKQILDLDEPNNPLKLAFPTPPSTKQEYYQIVMSTSHLNSLVSGILLSNQTINQITNTGQNFVDHLIANHIVPGIKIAPISTNLDVFLQRYYQIGIRFAEYGINLDQNLINSTPSNDSILKENCQSLANFASKCQAANLVPIISINIAQNPSPTNLTLAQSLPTTTSNPMVSCLLARLQEQNVNLHACILKTNLNLSPPQPQLLPKTNK